MSKEKDMIPAVMLNYDYEVYRMERREQHRKDNEEKDAKIQPVSERRKEDKGT